MTHKLALTLLAALVLAGAGVIGSVSQSFARTAQDFSRAATDISAQHKGKAGPRRAGPRSIGARHIGHRNFGQRNIGQRGIGYRSIGQRSIGQRDIGPRKVGQFGHGLRGASIRGATKATIAGRNFSIWRGRHRVRHGGRWRTFVGLGVLSAFALGSAYYYPYAYIDAPAAFCQGLTQEGCQLRWQAVPTLEGPPVFQCVAYCPWQ